MYIRKKIPINLILNYINIFYNTIEILFLEILEHLN
jgi:hypothetical protein